MNNVNKQEMRRWLDDPDEPWIWVKERENNHSSWSKQPFLSCNWLDNYIYIIDDKQAKLRKLQIDKPKTVFEYWNVALNKWVKTKKPYWIIYKKYRVKSKHTYPIFKVANKGTDKEYIVKFTGLNIGEVVFAMADTTYNIGYKSDIWIKLIDTETWEDILYDEKKGLYDKQAVLCWDDSRLVRRVIKFYDAKNKCTFNADGTRNGYHYDNYAPYPHPADDFIIEMYKNLEE